MIVGIDLGTTKSLIAYFSEEGPKIIPNRLGKNLTPSVVSVDAEGNVYGMMEAPMPLLTEVELRQKFIGICRIQCKDRRV